MRHTIAAIVVAGLATVRGAELGSPRQEPFALGVEYLVPGLAGINIGNLEDWGLFALAPTIAGTSAFHGLIETKGLPPRPGEPRPAYHALALVAQKLADFSAVQQLPLGTGIYCYQFTVRSKPIHVLWYDDGRRYLPGDTEPTATVELRLPPRPHRLTATPTERRVTTPPARTVVPSQGVLRLEAGSIPLFIEEEARP